MAKAKGADKVSKVNPFDTGEPPKSRAAPARALVPLPPEAAALAVQLSTAQDRIRQLETQVEDEKRRLADSEAGRRADLERLLREMGDLRATIATLEAQRKGE